MQYKPVSKYLFRGYKPYPHQKAVHSLLDDSKGTGRKVICKAKRQVGKSIMAENELLRFALKCWRSTSAVVSPVLAQSRKMYKDIIRAIENSGVIKKKNDSLLEIELINGSTILFKSGAQKDTLRGLTVDFLVLDEAAYLPDDILELVLPWTSVKKAPILVISTPKFKTGLFYTWYQQGLQDTTGKIVSVDWNDYDTSMLLSQEQMEEYRRLMPSAQYRTEILGEFLDEGDGVFITNADTWTGGADNQGKLYVGIDFANGDGNDYTVISAMEDTGNQVILEFFNDLTPLQQIDRITQILRRYKDRIAIVIAEKNSMGATYIDLLKRDNPGVRIEPFVTDNTSKREIIESLIVDIQTNEVRLIDTKESRLQFSCYRMEITKGGKITYNGYLANDDIVMSTALSNYGRTCRRGTYAVSGMKGRGHYAIFK